jgi:predicted amidohydrolase YtcJ
MAADLALLSQDVLTVPLDKLPSTTSVLTIIYGTSAYRDPAFVGAH